MVVSTLLIIFCIIFTKNGVSSENKMFPCRTPDNIKGFCVSIFDCPELIKMVHETGQDGANFAKKSLCLGCINNDSWVCCKNPRNTTLPSVIPTIPDIFETEDSLAMRKKNNLNQLKRNAKFCGEQHSGYRVGLLGETNMDEHPWLVQIKHSLDEPISMRCNGVIIEKHYILTTSNCGYRAQTAILGQYNTNEKRSCKIYGGQESDCTDNVKELVVEAVAHSNKASDDQYGLTLLNVKEPITYTDYVRSICLPLNRTELSTTEKELYNSGWLYVNGDKKEERYKTSPPEACFNIDEQLKEKVKEENISLMCLIPNSYPDVPYCAFDFGGPLIYYHRQNKWYLDGLITNGFQKDESICSISNATGIYLTPNLIDFIVSNIVF